MSDIIKHIGDASNVLGNDYILIDGCDGKEVDRARDIAIAALTVLQKIASGDDWFNIETAPRDGTWFLTANDTNEYFDVTKYSILYEGDTGSWWTTKGMIIHPYRWKHIDGEKHIKMMMERELNK